MRPAISWSELRSASVGLWGMGVEGHANLRKLQALGVRPTALVDDRPGPAGTAPEVLATAAGGAEALARCEVVVKSPGISRYRPEVAALEAAGVAVAGGLGLWLGEADRSRVVCVTGTKGKSTTVSVAGHLIRGLGFRCVIGGNIGRPPWDPEVAQDADFWVIETSSYQSTDVATSPPVVAVTSLHPDHLDWHGGVEAYYADKLSLCTQPGAELTIANGDDEVVRSHRSELGPRVEWITLAAPVPAWAERLGLLGDHNRRNALIAAACAEALGVPGSGDPDALAEVAAGFDALPSRLRPIGTVDGVTFVDDSLSTNVLPTVAALEVFAAERVALLVGGYDRHIDYAPLAEHLAARTQPTLVLALPDTGARVAAALAAALAVAPAGAPLEVHLFDELAPAVAAGWAWARPDGVVLLSPAAASFGRYRDYTERAAAFAAAMARCVAD
jgi:UDP-N-acetylmuramoylalanine--D-glutamate ligase